MIGEPKILKAKVWHKRTTPRVNDFTYNVYYLAYPLAALETMQNWLLRLKGFGLISLPMKDHGAKDGSDYRDWAQALLSENGLSYTNDQIVMLTLPRVMGYAFNPVTFWFCYEINGDLTAVIAEVNNTFGESHSYLILNDDHSLLSSDTWMKADKQFHVSPFFEVEGEYQFKFRTSDKRIGVWIDYYRNRPGDEGVTLHTSIDGKLIPYNSKNLGRVFCQIPHVTFKVIALIHWQAIKLWWKKVAHYRKPRPPSKPYSKWKQNSQD